jgi:hypothetical protein
MPTTTKRSNPILEAFTAYTELSAINMQIADLEKQKRELKDILEAAYPRSTQLNLAHPSQPLVLTRKENQRNGYMVKPYTFWTYDVVPK